MPSTLQEASAPGRGAAEATPARTPHPSPVGSLRRCDAYDDFDVLVPIYGDVKYLENVAFLRRYGRRVLPVHHDRGKRRVQPGARAHRPCERISDLPRAVDRVASEREAGTLRHRARRLVRDALGQVRAEYVVCIDADSTCPRPLDELVGQMVAWELDMASVAGRAIERRDILAHSAASPNEYRFAMHIRTVVPWLVSGACHVARTEVHREDSMSRHSLFFQGNDVEIGILAKGLGYRVGHIRFDVATAVPETLKPWFRQRLAWAGGEVRLFIANPQIALRHPFFWFYGALLRDHGEPAALGVGVSARHLDVARRHLVLPPAPLLSLRAQR